MVMRHAGTEDRPEAMPTGNMNDDHALVLFSGGQDSATCLAWALARYPLVETVGFAYGQRHAVELDCRGPVRAGDRRDVARAARTGPHDRPRDDAGRARAQPR